MRMPKNVYMVEVYANGGAVLFRQYFTRKAHAEAEAKRAARRVRERFAVSAAYEITKGGPGSDFYIFGTAFLRPGAEW